MIRKILRVLMPIAVIGLGIVVLGGLVATKPTAKKTPAEHRGTLVEVTKTRVKTHEVSVIAYGSVQPAREVVISPEVTGRVAWINEKLIPGSVLRKGERLVRIQAYDYVLAAQQLKASLDRARTDLQLEQSRKKIAEKEWKLMGGEKPADDGGLALREPQLRTAKAALAAARANLQRAQLNIGRTNLTVPFNAVVRKRQTDVGQLVGPQTALVSLVGTDAYWVMVMIPISKLAWVDIPGIGGVQPKAGSEATVRQEIRGQVVERKGRVIRLLGELDPVGKMARVLIEIEDPLHLAKRKPHTAGPRQLPLLLGSFVRVSIGGRTLENVVEIPREALRSGDSVYVIKEGKLVIKKVKVAWRNPSSVIISEGLGDGEQLIVSPVPAPVHGMKVRTATEGAKAPASSDEQPVPAAKKRPTAEPVKPAPGKPAKPKKPAKPAKTAARGGN